MTFESGDVVAVVVVVVAIHLFLFGAMVREWRRDQMER